MDEDDSTEVPPLSSNAAQRHQISKKSTGGRGTGTQASRTSSPHLPHDQSIARDTRTARKDTRGSQFASRTRDASPEGIGNVHHLQSASRRQGPSSEAVRDAASRAMSSKSAGLRDPRKRNPSLDIIHTPTLLAKNSTSSSSRNASSRMGPPPNFDGVARTEMGRPQPHGTYLARSTDNIMNAVSGSSRRGPESPSRYTPSSTSTRIYTAKQTQPRETRRDEASPIFSAGVAGSSRRNYSQLYNDPSVRDRRELFPLPVPLKNTRAPNRKISNPDSLVGESPSSRRRSIMTTTPQLLNVNVKSTPTSPFWRDADDEYEKARGNGRRGNEEEREINKRLAMSTSRPRTSVPGRGMPQIIPPPHRPKAYLGPKLKLTQPGEDNDGSDSPMEIDDDPPQDRRVVVRAQTGFKAARKREWPQRPSCSSPSEGDTEELPSSSEDDPDSDSDAPGDGDHDIEEIVAEARRSFKQPEIEILPGPPPGLAFKVRARPVLKEEVQQVVVPPPAAPPESREQVTNAIESLTGSIIRMQKTKQLPFLLRNLRNGFLGRCRELSIPVDRIPGSVWLDARYEYNSENQGQHIVDTHLDEWICPLCELHATFATREMVERHLTWDHHTVTCQWLLENNANASLEEEEGIDTHISSALEDTRVTTPPPNILPGRNIPSPLPFVTLSPPQSPRNESPIVRAEPQIPFSSAKKNLLSTPRRSARSRSSPTPAPTSSRGRSTTAATNTTTTTTSTTSTAQRAPRNTRYPTPPPASNPLGPSAQPPYLPAEPDEPNGHIVYYSCRPGGPYLYDLVDTLPMEEFGVLKWEVIDREDEIWDSDNVKDEYKVMHALWGRWITLNRNLFIKDYSKGTIAFVDRYWRMIHRAAGWDALRYWLLMLVANRFINGVDVAKTLKHYEGLTGMDTWYD